MTRIPSGLLMALAVGLSAFTAAQGVWADAPAQPKLETATEFNVRDGLPNVAEKLKSGAQVNVVFLGGSITVGGASPKGYVTFVTDWLKKSYPDAKVKVFNAGISGTGSDFGAKRYDRDVLSKDPDLVLVEFCVNDGDRDMTQHMERIVHKTWLKNPKTDILFFYTLANSHLKSYKDGMLPPSASAHERVAAFYGIPTVGTGFAAASKINSGEIKWEQFSGDSCHPKQEGYEIFDAAFAKAFPEFLKGEPKAHAFGKSITANLQVYPPPLSVKPVDASAVLATSNGEKSLKAYPVPVPAVNWIKEPSFDGADGKTLWRLSWLPRKAGGKLDSTVGADKAQWEPNAMTWFEEDKCFTGPSGTALFRGAGETATVFGATPGELGILRFIAPATGRYALSVRSGKIEMWQNDDKTLSLSVLKFSWNGSKGEPLALVKEVKKDSKGVTLDLDVKLLAGEEIVFITDIDAPGYIGGSWRDFKALVGFMGEN